MKKVDIKLGYICNNHCDFCIQWEEKRVTYAPKWLSTIYEILISEYKKWASMVTFTGWEPTLHKTLIPSIVFAKKLGYEIIHIQSNWQNFSRFEYVKMLVDAGANFFEPSIHGYFPQTHDFLVKTPGSWKKVIQGISNLKKLQKSVNINSVITRRNYKETPLLAYLLVKLKVDSFQFAFPHIWGSAKKYWQEVVPTKTEIMPYIHKALDIAKSWWVRARTEAIPFCFMQWYEYAITEQYLIESSVFDEAYRVDSYTNYRLYGWKSKQEKCKQCKKFSICEWPWKEYPELFGWGEFIPIPL